MHGRAGSTIRSSDVASLHNVGYSCANHILHVHSAYSPPPTPPSVSLHEISLFIVAQLLSFFDSVTACTHARSYTYSHTASTLASS